MYLCGNCRIFESDDFRECYSHTAQCTDYYYNSPDYVYSEEN